MAQPVKKLTIKPLKREMNELRVFHAFAVAGVTGAPPVASHSVCLAVHGRNPAAVAFCRAHAGALSGGGPTDGASDSPAVIGSASTPATSLLDATWPVLAEFVDAVHASRASAHSLQELCTVSGGGAAGSACTQLQSSARL